MLHEIKIYAGDFPNQQTFLRQETLTLPIKTAPDKLLKKGQKENIGIEKLAKVEKITEGEVNSIGGAVLGAWMGSGFGQGATAAGALMGGKKAQINFMAEFEDGRKMIGATDPQTFTMMKVGVSYTSESMEKIKEQKKQEAKNNLAGCLITIFFVIVLIYLISLFSRICG